MSPDAPDRKKQERTTVGIETVFLARPIRDANGMLFHTESAEFTEIRRGRISDLGSGLFRFFRTLCVLCVKQLAKFLREIRLTPMRPAHPALRAPVEQAAFRWTLTLPLPLTGAAVRGPIW
jgi:hypothetical protein